MLTSTNETIAAVGDAVGYSDQKYFSQLFKKELGCGYHAYLNQVRVEKAKKYLKQTNEPITVVAELVGFSDYRIFTKIFKGIVGVAPSQFRK